MTKPSDRDHTSVVNFIENGQPLIETERQFVYHKEDLITLRNGRDITWLDALVERTLRFIRCKPIEYIFCAKVNIHSSVPNGVPDML